MVVGRADPEGAPGTGTDGDRVAERGPLVGVAGVKVGVAESARGGSFGAWSGST